MTESKEIQPASRPVLATVRPPGSKSITNRALVCAALADGTSTLSGALDSEDTQVMIRRLQQLGIAIEVRDQGETLVVQGCQGVPPATTAEVFVGNSGTTIRFLTALVTLGRGTFRLDGIARMRERPIGDLAAALRQLGAEVSCAGPGECPPVAIVANRLPGGQAKIGGNISSQFLSGLLMAAPCAQSAVTVRVEGTLVSVPYVRMTLEVMKSFGVETQAAADFSEILISSEETAYAACEYAIEPDASAASYFWAAAAVTGGKVAVSGLSKDSLQGDVAFVDCLAKMGCDVRHEADRITVSGPSVSGKPLRGIDVDMNAISDTVQTLAVVALFAKGPTRIRNVAHIRHKETDRISALATELRKLGAIVVETDTGLSIDPSQVDPSQVQSAEIETYGDHRMAMSFAVAGLVQPGVVIRDPGCTTKTYPRFFEDLEAACSNSPRTENR